MLTALGLLGVVALIAANGFFVAVEFAFVLPVLLMIVAGIIQFGAIFFLQNNMSNAAREAARALAVGSIETTSETTDLVEQRLVNWGVTFAVNTAADFVTNKAKHVEHR